MMKTRRRSRAAAFGRDEGGAALVAVAVMLAGLLPMAALVIDLGRIYVVRAEAQAVADAAALAGAGALAEAGGDAARARRVATELAARNTVAGASVRLTTEDVVVPATVDSIAVTVHLAEERGTAVRTTFARLVGIDGVDVTARAAAVVTGTDAVPCLKPFIVPDAWDDANRNGRYDAGELYDAARTGYGTDWRRDAYVRDFGRPITLYPGKTGETSVPSWYYLLRLPGQAGGSDIRETIANTTCDNRITTETGVNQEPGAKTGPVRQGIDDLMAQDPDAYWDPTTRSVQGSRFGDAWRSSPRLMTIALFDPREPVQPGMKPITITNFATVFLEKTQSDQITGRLLSVMGLSSGSGCTGSNTCAPFARAVRLAE